MFVSYTLLRILCENAQIDRPRFVQFSRRHKIIIQASNQPGNVKADKGELKRGIVHFFYHCLSLRSLTTSYDMITSTQLAQLDLLAVVRTPRYSSGPRSQVRDLQTEEKNVPCPPTRQPLLLAQLQSA
jgi:hypothetical protein